MIHTLIKRGYKGFTLIELLVVIAIIGLLSTIIAAPIQNARKKARDSKKIAEIKAVQLALDQYAEANAGKYPITLAPLAPTYMPLLPGFAATSSTTVSPRDMFGYTPYEVSGAGLVATMFAYHMGVHLENYSQGLDNDRDCVGAENTSNYNTVNGTSTCAFYPSSTGIISWYYGDNTGTYNSVAGMMKSFTGTQAAIGTATNYQSVTPGAVSVTDFDGSDANIVTCNATEDCVFDVTQQQ